MSSDDASDVRYEKIEVGDVDGQILKLLLSRYHTSWGLLSLNEISMHNGGEEI